ncbi:DNA topoisomerase IB [Deinococcus geothermalis]|uniref:DNA topoisomerase n=1 Tax=Deinococcus geothermalis (strain DSM 11300 / CIP 105573 / AG-3a) TaxID=319795 RepID=Q1IWN2_DEIGD|nr:DNA topoisomerase IB [Deinococcus geothermalis]ABF46352.1 DNA topoisomerase IB [Deinococcus geothermalis DSM 11300]
MAGRTDLLHEEYLRREGNKPGEFRYFWPDGEEYTDPEGLDRIAALAVPPAYTEVYVSPDPDAELQAFGRDAAGRLQYRYHPDFVQAGALKKWQRLARFAGVLPTLRAVTAADLRLSGLPRRKVLAVMSRLLHVAHFRVGSDAYARAHRTYGLSTLRQRHVRVSGQDITFRFKGKHAILQEKTVRNRTLATNIERLLELPGPWLFQSVDEGERTRVRAPDLNASLREVIGPFTAKDFRTWGGTLLAAEFLAEAGPPETERQARKTIVECVKFVAADLGNTPAVTRGSYICPVIFDRYQAGKVLDDYEPRAGRPEPELEGLTRSEAALKRMLESEQALRTRQSRKKAKEAA